MRTDAKKRLLRQSSLPLGEHVFRAGSEIAWRFNVVEPSSREMIDYVALRSKHGCPIRSVLHITHYRTLMATILEMQNGAHELVYFHTGHGSVSDQQTMNVVFYELRMPYRYDRNGGRARLKSTGTAV